MGRKIAIGIICFIIAGGLSFFTLFKFSGDIFKTFLKERGEILFTDNISEEDRNELLNLTADLELENNVTISYELFDKKQESGFLVDAFVPTTDFYDAKNRISVDEFTTLF